MKSDRTTLLESDSAVLANWESVTEISVTEIDPAMDAQRFIFVIEIPRSSRKIFSQGGRAPFRSMSMPPRLRRPSMA
jgi:hypothetical protein